MIQPAAVFDRAEHKCELCSNTNNLKVYEISPDKRSTLENTIAICQTCQDKISALSLSDADYWNCLSGAIWSEHAATKVLCFRLLTFLKTNASAQDLLDQLYLTDEEIELAKSQLFEASDSGLDAPTLDAHGTKLAQGDSVTLIKDLDVKGAGFTAKRGTLVKNISLTSNPKHIEGRVNGTQIVIIAEYVKKG